jgi:hypothetical protein
MRTICVRTALPTGLLLAAMCAVTVTPGAAAAQRRSEQEASALDWNGTVAPGRTVYVRNMNGEITVRPADGPRASIVATKVWRRGNPEMVRVELRRVGGETGDVIACAFWTEKATCSESGYVGGRSNWRWDDEDGPGDVRVTFDVRLPAGVNLETSSINGGLNVDGVSGRVEAETVNGGVTARSSGGPVRAKTVNGSIDVSMGRAPSDDLEFETVNGGINVAVPDGVDAEITMKTVNGTVSTDFPVTVSGRINPKRLSAVLGKGGRRLSLVTVNGSVRLRKG